MTLLSQQRHMLLQHPMYAALKTPEHLRLFMEHHVFAVWDFMSLLKRLQRDLTCVEVPWVPANRAHVRLVNEIVLAEESDDDGRGGFVSHFELYLEAMAQVNADTTKVRRFVAMVQQGSSVPQALGSLNLPVRVQNFVQTTVDIATHGATHEVCAAFFFGREEIIPDVFAALMHALQRQGGKADRLKYYLKRHMQIDAEVHGPMAEALLLELCGDCAVKSAAAQACAQRCLQARLSLWDAVVQALPPSPVILEPVHVAANSALGAAVVSRPPHKNISGADH